MFTVKTRNEMNFRYAVILLLSCETFALLFLMYINNLNYRKQSNQTLVATNTK